MLGFPNKDNSSFKTFKVKIGYLQKVNLKCALSKNLLGKLLKQQEECERVTENINVRKPHRTPSSPLPLTVEVW